MTSLDDLPCEAPAPAPAPAWWSWLEVAGLCGLALAGGALAMRRDPGASGAGLAWLALAPLLAGLRYGAGHGVACGAAQAGALAAALRWDGTAAEVPLEQIALGWLVAGLLPGQFRAAWGRRLERAEDAAGELRARLSGLARQCQALRISLERLQREVPGSPSTLWDALAAFRLAPPEGIGDRVLALFRDHASARAATLHLVDRQGEAAPALAALGTGEDGAPAAADPLVREAVRLGHVVSARDLPADGVLAAIPLPDAEGRVVGVVAVREVPFLSLHAEALAVMAVLGAHAGVALARALRTAPGAGGGPARSALPLAPPRGDVAP